MIYLSGNLSNALLNYPIVLCLRCHAPFLPRHYHSLPRISCDFSAKPIQIPDAPPSTVISGGSKDFETTISSRFYECPLAMAAVFVRLLNFNIFHTLSGHPLHSTTARSPLLARSHLCHPNFSVRQISNRAPRARRSPTPSRGDSSNPPSEPPSPGGANNGSNGNLWGGEASGARRGSGDMN